MNKLVGFLTLAVLVFVPRAALSQSSAISITTVGVGPHGYDWQIGTWSCTNPTPSAMSGPAHQTETVTKTNTGAILSHTTGTNYDFSSYNAYVPAKKMWVNPYSGADGTYGSESTSQTGKKIVWVGSTYFPELGKVVPTRDTYVNSPNKVADLGEVNSGGVWKTQYNITCTKT